MKFKIARNKLRCEMKLDIKGKIKHIVSGSHSNRGYHYGMKIQNLRKVYELYKGDFGALLGMNKGQISLPQSQPYR